MDSWVKQIGYPIIEVTAKDSKVSLTQKRYLAENEGRHQKGTWIIPVSLKTSDSLTTKLMTRQSETIVLKDIDWFKLNSGQMGMYRVKYGDKTLEKFKELVEQKVLSNTDRWGLQHDFFALCMSGQISLKRFLDFARSYLYEDDYLVSSDLAGSLDFLYLVTSGEVFWDEIKEYNKEHFQKLFDRLGWDKKEGEKHTTALLRSLVIGSLGRLGDKEILEEAKKRFEEFLKKPDSLHPDLRSVVYSLVAWDGDNKTYEILLKQFRKATMQEEKLRFIGALSNFHDERLLARTLKFVLTKEVRSQNLHLPIMRVAANPYGRKLVWPWVKKNWKQIVKKFGVGSPLINRVVGTISVVYDSKKESEIRRFFKLHPAPGTEMKLAQTLERLRIYSKFLERTRKEILLN
ncbi:MAG: ERAP1-like C-terminal domain-containing protein, partial [Nitrosopumilaceae archaeon]